MAAYDKKNSRLVLTCVIDRLEHFPGLHLQMGMKKTGVRNKITNTEVTYVY
jgi:hypothetical protein